METIINIGKFIIESFLHIWPSLLITIPVAVAVNMTGASKMIDKAFSKNPVLSILLATAVGAFSPFCSCGVIPIISSLLLGGVPLAPVMSFWIASPSMDPEIYFLSTSVLGWNLATWRLVSTFLISLLAGYFTHMAMVKGYLSGAVLKISGTAQTCSCETNSSSSIESFSSRLKTEIIKATLMVVKFMGIAFLIGGIIKFLVPVNFFTSILKGSDSFQVLIATAIGIPMYTSNLMALPLVGGLVDSGLNQGAALSFLIAGSTTTLPAMAAVWGLTRKRVFLLYVSYSISGALAAGLLFNLLN